MNVELIVVVFDKADKAAQALEDVRALERSRVIRVTNAAVLANEDGKVSIKEAEDVDAKHGALFGAITGGLLGLSAGPAGVIVGAAAGAATGGLAAQGIDMGFPNADLDDLRDALQPNSSALVLLIENRWVEKVAEDLAYLEGKLYRHALKAEVVAQFDAAEAEMEQQMAALAAKQAAVHQELYAETTARIQAMRTEIEALEAKIETADADKKGELRGQVEALREKVKTDYEALNKKIEAQIQEGRAKIVELRTSVANVGHKAKNELYQQIEALYLEVDAARAEMQENLASQVEEGRAEVESLKAKVAESTAATKEKLQAQLAAAQANLENVQEKLQSTIEAQVEETEADLNEFQLHMALGKMEYDGWITSLRARWYAARQKFQHALETQLQELENNVEEDVTTVRARRAQVEARLRALRPSSRAEGQDPASGMAEAKADLQKEQIMVQPVFNSGLESPLLKQIQKDMKVYDRQGDKIGEVESVYLGSVDEAADAFGLGPESTDDADLDGGRSWVEALANVFADDDELPEELHSRLLRHGFIRIGGSGLFASDYYASSDQIASVSEDRVQLNSLKDELIKR